MDIRNRWTFLFLFYAIAASPVYGQDDWFPYPIYEWKPAFAENAEREPVDYVPLDRASQKWNIAVFIPHLKDSYWMAVNYGLVAEAKRQGMRLQIFQAGGYALPKRQHDQVKNALSGGGFDGFIISAVSSDGLNDLILSAKEQGLPVVDLINGISSPDLAARSATP